MTDETSGGQAASESPRILMVMGVSGSGKTTVGAMLAGRLGWEYAEADDFHPPDNVVKMQHGHPLTDEDRWPWLRAIAEWMHGRTEPAVVSCSALKRSYRELLRREKPDLGLIYLDGTKEMIGKRMAARQGHFFPAKLLDTQFAALEPPGPDEHPLVVPVDGTPQQTVNAIMEKLQE